MTTSTIHKVWVGRISDDERWAYGIIRQWVNAVYPLAAFGHRGGHRTNLTADEAVDLTGRFKARVDRIDGGPLVHDEQAEIGRNWLASTGVRFGLPRDVDYHAISHFRLEGVALVHENRWGVQCAPEYRAFWPDGRELAYHATPWQAGSDFTYRMKEAA